MRRTLAELADNTELMDSAVLVSEEDTSYLDYMGQKI